MQSQEIHQAVIWSLVLPATVWHSHTDVVALDNLHDCLEEEFKTCSLFLLSSQYFFALLLHRGHEHRSPPPRWFVKWILLNAVSSYCHSYKPRNRRLPGWAENSWLVTRQRTNSYAKPCACLRSLIGGTMGSLLCEIQLCRCLSPLSVDLPQVWMKCFKTKQEGLLCSRCFCFSVTVEMNLQWW